LSSCSGTRASYLVNGPGSGTVWRRRWKPVLSGALASGFLAAAGVPGLARPGV